MTYVITLVGGIGNIIQTTPLMKHLMDSGHRVVARMDKDAFSKTACELVSPAYHELIPHGQRIEGAIDKGRMLATEFGKQAVKKHPEWASWFLFHGIPVPQDGKPTTTIVEGNKPELSFDVVIAPTCKSNWPMKRYPYWQEVVSAFPGCAIVGLAGDGGELSGDFTDYRGKTSLLDVVGLARQAKVVICEEGGVGHVSAATGTPTVILFGGTSVKKNLPPVNGYALQSDMPLSCRPCQTSGKWYTSGSGLGRIYHGCHPKDMVNGATRCMESITPVQIIKEARKWLSIQQ